MENARIRKLLALEYTELASEKILVESPFAETTRDGRGVRQVALGLTRSRLIVATDYLGDGRVFCCAPHLDPSIESLELVSIYPLQFVSLSVFRRRRRKALKARLVDGRAKYYELGGMRRRSLYWSRWCDQVRRILELKCLGSSLSETTASASSSCASSSCRLPSSGFEYDSSRGRCSRRRAGGRACRRLGPEADGGAATWTRKDLYLGAAYEELRDGHYAPRPLEIPGASVEDVKLVTFIMEREPMEVQINEEELENLNTQIEEHIRYEDEYNLYLQHLEKINELTSLNAVIKIGLLLDNMDLETYKKIDTTKPTINETILLNKLLLTRLTLPDELADCSPDRRGYFSSCSSEPEPRPRGIETGDQCGVIWAQRDEKRYPDQRLAKTSSSSAGSKREHHELLDYRPSEQRLSRPRCPSIVLDIEDPQSEFFASSRSSKTCSSSSVPSRAKKMVRRLSRFRFGVEEKCSSSLCAEACPIPDARKLLDSAVALWEAHSKSRSRARKKHLRRYGISTSTYFLHALGPWSVQPGDRDSVQRRRSHSCASIRRQPMDSELRLPVSRRQLAASVSLTDLSSASLAASTRGRVVLFWTPDYWYRPRAATDAYNEIRRHLGQLRQFQAERQGKGSRRIFGRKARRYSRSSEGYDACSQTTDSSTGCTLNRIFSRNATPCCASQPAKYRSSDRGHSTTAHLRKLLRLDFRVTLWDVDSTTLAGQLTLIDRELFLRVPRRELAILDRQRSSREAPNLAAWVAFAHRISCLTASEILSAGKLEMRARLVARLLNAAEKCLDMGNFHSARSIVAGLQSPAVYRLRATWMYLKVHHATRYETMEKLGKVFKNVRTKKYRKRWMKAEREPPAMPFVGDVLARLLGLRKEANNWDHGAEEKAEAASRKAGSKATDKMADIRRLQKGGFKRWVFPTVIPEVKCCSPTRDKTRRPTSQNPKDWRWTPQERKLARRFCTRWRKRARLARDEHRRRLDELGDWLERCQRHAHTYDFPGQSLAWEFLLKARYREDRDNFFQSLQLEPTERDLEP